LFLCFGGLVRPSRIVLSVSVAIALAGTAVAVVAGTSGSAATGRHHGRATSADILMAVQPATTAGATASAAPAGTPTAAPKPTTPKPTTNPKPHPTPPSASHSVVDQVLAQINGLRAQHGLPPYSLLAGLNASAHAHTLRMTGSCGMQHQCPGEASLGARISAQGVHWSSCGENIGWSGPHPNTTSAIVAAAEGLTTSMYNEKPPDDGHRRNLLSTSFHHIGIDVIRDSSGKVWITQDFSS
jgi:uncharacterized protein YkwD